MEISTAYLDRWRSRDAATFVPFSKLEPGTLIVKQRRPFRITAISEINYANWPQEYTDAFLASTHEDPDTWSYRPRRITGHWEDQPAPEPGKDRLGLIANDAVSFDVLPEHYSVCRQCGELPPCAEIHNQGVVERAMATMDKAMAILPGFCHACCQPVTRRQRSIRFPGANLIRPDLPDNTALFHLRNECWSHADAYDQRWAKAEPGRRRMMFCDGHRRHHFDGTTECTEGDLCVGDVRHSGDEYHRPDYESARGCWCLAGAAATTIILEESS